MIIKIDIDCDDLEKIVALLEDSADCCEDMAAQYEDNDDYEEEVMGHLTEAATCRRLIGYMETCIRHAYGKSLPGFSCN
jgi:hypothetical protein